MSPKLKEYLLIKCRDEKNEARNIYSVSDIGLDTPAGFGVGVTVLHYSKSWPLLSKRLQSTYKEKIDTFLELVTNSNYGTLICYDVSGIK